MTFGSNWSCFKMTLLHSHSRTEGNCESNYRVIGRMREDGDFPGYFFFHVILFFISLIWFGCLFLPCSAFTRNPVAFKLETKRRKSKCRHNATSVLLWRKKGKEGREKPWTKYTNKRVEEGGGHVKGEISTVNSQWRRKEGEEGYYFS